MRIGFLEIGLEINEFPSWRHAAILAHFANMIESLTSTALQLRCQCPTVSLVHHENSRLGQADFLA